MKILLHLYFIRVKSEVLLQQSLNHSTALRCDHRYFITIQFEVLQPLLPLHFNFQYFYNRYLITIQFSVVTAVNYNKV